MPAIVCDEQPFDQQHFLDLLDQQFGDYLLPWKLNKNSGYEIIQAMAKIGERLSLAVNRWECGGLAIFAEGGMLATVDVVFFRTVAFGPFTIKAGTVVTTSNGDRRFYVVEDAFLDAMTASKVVPVVAVTFGYEWNVTGQVTTPDGKVLEGEIDTIQSLITDPPFNSVSDLAVRQIDDAVGGKSADIDVVGDERGVFRASGEGDDPYRHRVRTVPDTISPDAVERLAHALLDPWGLTFEFIETWQVDYMSCWDAPSPNAGTPTYDAGTPPTNPAYDDTTFVYDDPRDPDPFRNRWLDDLEMRGAFIVVVRRDVTLQDYGVAFDDAGTTKEDFRPVGGPKVGLGWRGTPAFDSGGGDVAFPNVYIGVYDGEDTLRQSVYAGLFFQLQDIKAAGVAAIVDYVRP